MKLTRVHVTLFKNILDSTPVDMERDITCFVGKNESGKTAFLHALYRLHPANASAVFNAQQQYPAWLEKAHRRGGNDLADVKPVHATFEAEPSDIAKFEERFGEGSLASKEIVYSREYSGQGYLDYKTNEDKAMQFLINGLDVPADFKESAARVSNLAELDLLRKALEANGGAACKEACTALDTKKTEMLGKATDVRKAMLSEITAMMPKFFYFDEYSALPGTIKVAELLQKKRDTLTEDEATARSLLDLAGAEKDYLLNPDYEIRKRELENVANSLTQDVLEYWSTNPELRVHMDFTQRTVQMQPPQQGVHAVLDELKIRLWDDRHLLSLPFDQRSSDFRWFFSFLAAFSHYEQSAEAIIILLDEPGLGLHARAQHDFLRFIEERLAKRCQVLYTTHSPFLVQPSHLERARLVQDEGRNKGARITSDVLSIDKDTLFPLQGALGYDLAQHLFVAQHNLVVEGTSDYTYLLVMSDHLKASGRTALDERWSIIPVGGADLVPSFVALLGHHLDVTVVVDSRKEGHQRLLKMADQKILERNRIIAIGEITKTRIADIEDLFTADEYLILYNKAFGASIKSADLAGSDPIVSRIARFIGVERFDHGLPADVLLRNRETFLASLGPDTLNRFEGLFKKINATLEKSEESSVKGVGAGS
jgi:energy-coupling factor transporter ATP-binding protein EcfA2